MSSAKKAKPPRNTRHKILTDLDIDILIFIASPDLECGANEDVKKTLFGLTAKKMLHRLIYIGFLTKGESYLCSG
jgi:hypothetical protein